MLRTLRVILLCLALVGLSSDSVQNRSAAGAQPQLAPSSSVAPVAPLIDPEIQARIRKEAAENSSIMRTMHYLTDIYGPRLTGSPNLKAAGEWAIKQMAEWGLENGHLEGWEFGHPGWTNERLIAHIVSPLKEPLTCEVMAWTPGTNGPVMAQVFQLAPPTNPTLEELTTFLNGAKEKVKGKIVMVDKPQTIGVNFNPPPKRRDDQAEKARYSSDGPNINPTVGAQPSQNPESGQPKKLLPREVNEQIDAFLLSNGALIRVNDGGREHRQIRAFGNRSFDPSKVLPTVILSNEDFGRISRIMGDGVPVEIEFDIVNRLYPEGRTAYNVISEIPGTDKKDEVIMLGGHLDSWHAATGATDNAIGCAVMMETARILRQLGVKPRRTIRIVLWSGEEQGLLGSQAYIKEHFGSFEEPKPNYFKFGGYFNIDSGTGRARGMGVFGPSENADILRQALAAFGDLGFFGAISTRVRSLGGSDNSSFNQAGLPGIGVAQDPIEYFTATWHTNLDTYERIVEDDAKKSATIIAAAVYYLAMRDELLLRFGKDQMPPPPLSR